MDDYIAGIHSAWLGERLGHAAFMARAEAEHDDSRAEQWQVLARLEEATGDRMINILKSHGEQVDDEPIVDLESEAFQAYLALPHDDVMSYMRDRVISALSRFEHLLAMAPEADLVNVQFLVDHELALLDYVDAELAGGGDSLKSVRAML